MGWLNILSSMWSRLKTNTVNTNKSVSTANQTIPTNKWDPKDLKSLAKTIVEDKDCIIFVGAGLSRPLHYPPWNVMLEELFAIISDSTRFAAKTKRRIMTNLKNNRLAELLDDLNEVYRHHFGQYSDLLKEMFSPKYPLNYSRVHSDIIRLVNDYSEGIITTNFDGCLETARDAEKLNHIITTTNIDDMINHDKKYIYHIHNTYENLSNCVVCSFQYADLYFNGLFINKLEQELATHTILYLGTSLNDYEIKHILNKRATVCLPANQGKFSNIKEHYAIVPVRDDWDPREEKDTMYNQYKIRVQHYTRLGVKDTDDYGPIEDHSNLEHLIAALIAECATQGRKFPIAPSQTVLDK